MSVLGTTLIALALAFLIHWVWWRVSLPRHQTKYLLLLFLAVFLLAGAVVGYAGFWRSDDLLSDVVFWLYFGSFYWVAAFTYVITYSAMEGDSPTLSLALTLARSRTGQMSPQELQDFFRRRPFVEARINAMINDGLLVPDEGGRYRLTRTRCRPFDLILWWRRRILGFKEFGG
jgi:hypothetical protein